LQSQRNREIPEAQVPVRPERVLIIDPDLASAQSLEAFLRLHVGESTRTTIAASTDSAMLLIEAGDYDLALLDPSIDDANRGLDLIHTGLALHPRRPFILVTGMQDSSLRGQALQAGAVDVLDKADLTPGVLLRAIRLSFDRAAARDTLVEARDRFRDHFMNSAGAWQSTLDGRMISGNTAAAAILGYETVEELQTINTSALHVEPKEHEAFSRELERHGRITHRELRLKRRDGSIIWCLVNAAVSHAAGNRPATVDCTLIDLTDRRFLQAQLRQAQKMEALGRLAGGVAHDFNNLLTAILGYCELVLIDLPTGSRMAVDVGHIQAAGERARDLTQQLLVFSRKQALRPDVVNIRTALARFDGLVPRLLGEHIQVTTHVPPDLWNVRIDPSQLEQILLNLAVNASDAMPRGGRLTMETHNVELDAQYVRLHPVVIPGQYVLLVMSDTGSGMSPAVRAHAFEPFFTTKPVGKGTGLGLSTVYGIVKQNGGYIWIYSEEGHGTSFKIFLPRVDAQEQPKEPAAKEAEGRGTETVLLVEDEDAVRALAQVVLERNGYEVLSARTAAEAIGIAGSEGRLIHVLLTDVVMPLMSGPELARRLREIRPGLNVLFMSGYTANAIVDQGLLESGAPFLSKPFSPSSLALAVRGVLDGHSNATIPESSERGTPRRRPQARKPVSVLLGRAES
jgi:two-component system cell cycle sensor histidine kinase/response regulator CckA